jgi:ankyrin repeat protein
MSRLIDALLNIIDPRLESIQALLASGGISVDYQEPEQDERTALIIALDMEREDLALEIIQHGANVALASTNGGTPLMFACFKNLPNAAKEIALRVPDLEVTDGLGLTAMLIAAKYSGLDIFRMLVRRGASVLAKTRNGKSVFQVASRRGHLAATEYLLAEFDIFSVHECDTEGNQPLHSAASMGESKMARWLIDRGAVVDAPAMDGTTAMMCASEKGNIDTARILVQAGAEIDIEDGDFWTPLVWAASEGQLLMARQLLLWGATVNPVPDLARSMAGINGHGGVVKLLDSWGNIKAVWVVRSAGHVRRLANRSALKRLPKELCRLVGPMIICL